MPHTKPAFEFLEKKIPFFKDLGIKSMLYVGWRHDCHPWWHDTFAKQLEVSPLSVLEIFPKNISDLEHLVWSGRYPWVETYLGDARATTFDDMKWDLVFWDHGPEHVSFDDLPRATNELFRISRRALLYACPWGDWPQGAEDGNENEIHRNSIGVGQLLDLGMTVHQFGAPGQKNEGELVAYRVRT